MCLQRFGRACVTAVLELLIDLSVWAPARSLKAWSPLSSVGMPSTGMLLVGMLSAGMPLTAVPGPSLAVGSKRPGKALIGAVRGMHSSSTGMDAGCDEQSLNALAHNGVEIGVQKVSRDSFRC